MSQSDSSSEIVGDEAPLVPGPPARGRRRNRLVSSLAAFHRVFLIVAFVDGFWDTAFLAEGGAEVLGMGEVLIVGVVMSLAWAFVAASETPASDNHRRMHELALRVAFGARGAVGFIEYPISAVARLQELVRVAGGIGEVLAAIDDHLCVFGDRLVSVGQVVAQWRAAGARGSVRQARPRLRCEDHAGLAMLA